MHIIIDQLDGEYYSDLIITYKELRRMEEGEMINGETTFKRKKCYVGIRLQGLWNYERREKETDF